MLIRITFKDPDRVGDAIQESVIASVQGLTWLTQDEKDAVIDRRYDNVRKATEEFIEYQEYVTIEIDTDAGTARVVPVSDI
jgi:hypothetical protein